jgi:hypothetical protein
VAPLAAAGASLLGARLSLGPGRSCDVTSWDAAARRGEAVDSGGRPGVLVAPAPAPRPGAPGAGWLGRFLGRTFGPGFDAGPPDAGDAARVARVHAAAGASRLGRVRGLRGELALALALEAGGPCRVREVAARGRTRGGAPVDLDLVTEAGGAVCYLTTGAAPAAGGPAPRDGGGPRALPAARADVAAWADVARAIARGDVTFDGRPLRAAYCYCEAGFDAGAAALLRAAGATPVAAGEAPRVVR